jgi:hypothetical protein
MPNSNIDIEISEFIASAVDAQAGYCYLNSFKALFVPGFSDCLYVQGFAVEPGDTRPEDHCWLEKNGRLIEPTVLTLGANMVYFPAEKFSVSDRAAALLIDSERVAPYSSLIPEVKDFNSYLYGREKHRNMIAGNTYRLAWLKACNFACGSTDDIFPDPETIREIVLGERDPATGLLIPTEFDDF